MRREHLQSIEVEAATEARREELLGRYVVVGGSVRNLLAT
jgi:hypothetical protein